MRTCHDCRFCAAFTNDQGTTEACVALPPKPEMRTEANGATTILGIYPPVPRIPCGLYQRRSFWRRQTAFKV